MIGPGLVVIGFLASAAFTIFYLIKSRHIERMAKIEHGIIGDEEPAPNKTMLTLGVLFSALGVAVFTSYVLSLYTAIPDYISMPGFLLLFGGLGFIFSYAIGKGKHG